MLNAETRSRMSAAERRLRAGGESGRQLLQSLDLRVETESASFLLSYASIDLLDKASSLSFAFVFHLLLNLANKEETKTEKAKQN